MGRDGKVLLFSGSADFGQGPYRTQALIISRVLGVDPQDVEVTFPDTDRVPDASMTSASRSTYMVGNAVLSACLKIRSALVEIAAPLLEVDPDQLEMGEGRIWERADSSNSVEIPRLARLAWEMRQPLAADGIFRMWHSADPGVRVDRPEPRTVLAFGTHIAQVLVDTDTGHIQVERIWAAHDVGQAINPMGIEGQIDGGVAMGVGYALLEELLQENGHLLNAHLSEYIAPLVTEMPTIEPIIIQVPEPSGPLGARGIGEITTVPVAPAIANAVADAVGARMTEIPMTPPRVWWALRNSNPTP
jgi:CO/xanthine dehydrogenase Mo-binding subunit